MRNLPPLGVKGILLQKVKLKTTEGDIIQSCYMQAAILLSNPTDLQLLLYFYLKTKILINFTSKMLKRFFCLFLPSFHYQVCGRFLVEKHHHCKHYAQAHSQEGQVIPLDQGPHYVGQQHSKIAENSEPRS